VTKARAPDVDCATDLGRLLEEILVDAYGDDEQLWAFRQAFEDAVSLPADGFVIGELVSVTAIDYDGNARRGLTATCRRADGSEHVVAVPDVVFPEGFVAYRYVAAYRRWLGLGPPPEPPSGTPRRARRRKAEGQDLDLGRPVELVVLAVRETAARCRDPVDCLRCHVGEAVWGRFEAQVGLR